MFTVPCGVHKVHVLVVGGGSGGLRGEMGGGGSGYVRNGEFNVKPLEKIGITVGIGGAGSPFHPSMWNQSSKPGGTSSFGY